MITKKRPYYGCNKRYIRKLIINYSLPPITEDIPKDMSRFLNLCLQYEPLSRPSALVLLEHDFLKGKATPEQLAASVKEAMYFKSLREDE